VIGHNAPRVKVVSHAIEELERRSDELTVLAQKAFAVAEIEVVIQPDRECSIEFRAVGTESASQHLFALLLKLRDDLSRQGIAEAKRNEVKGLVDLPVWQTTARLDLNVTGNRDEIIVTHILPATREETEKCRQVGTIGMIPRKWSAGIPAG